MHLEKVCDKSYRHHAVSNCVKPRNIGRITNDRYIHAAAVVIYLIYAVYLFIEVSKYLLSLKDGLYILSERFNQDPLESFFGKQGARGRRNGNLNVRTFMFNTQAVRVQQIMAIGDGGNVWKRKEQWSKDLDQLSRPLRILVVVTCISYLQVYSFIIAHSCVVSILCTCRVYQKQMPM